MVAEFSQASKKLTAKEERFCFLVAAGKDQTSAWCEAYGKVPKHHSRVNASRVANRPHVLARIAELRKPDEKRLFLTRARKREILMEMAETRHAGMTDRQRAIDIDNRMTAEYTQTIQVEGEITLNAVVRSLATASIVGAKDAVMDLEEVKPLSIQEAGVDMFHVEQSEQTEPVAAPAAQQPATPSPFGGWEEPESHQKPKPTPKAKSRSYEE